MMKKVIALLTLSLLANFALADGQTKKVCKEDAKTKKQVCKEVKIHKKLDGTKVPPK